jgi:hypothetical protein
MKIEFNIDIYWAVVLSIVVLVGIIVLFSLYAHRGRVRDAWLKRNWLVIIVASTVILSLSAFIISVYILHCRCIDCNRCCGSDSIVVASFGVIVTFLVGWDIYKVIDINKRMDTSEKKANDQTEDMKDEFDKKAKELEDIFDKKISIATNKLAKIAMQKDCEGNILANIQNVSVLSQATNADSIVTAISYCALNIREIREIKKSDFVKIQEGDYSLENFIETIKINIDKNFFESAKIDVLKKFLERIEGITGTDKETNELAEIKRKIYKIVASKEINNSK